MTRFLVSAAVVRHQSVELPDGQLCAIEMATPAAAFVVMFESDGHREIISLHRTETEAVSRCKQLASHIEEVGRDEGAEGRVLQ